MTEWSQCNEQKGRETEINKMKKQFHRYMYISYLSSSHRGDRVRRVSKDKNDNRQKCKITKSEKAIKLQMRQRM